MRLLQRQRGILGWRAHAAPSATLLSASQSNCSKQRKERNLASCDSYLELMNHITVEIIPSTPRIKRCGVAKPNTKETKIGEHYSQSQASFFFLLCTTLCKSTVIVRVFVCVHVSVCVSVEGWERNLALDFMPDWPIFKKKKSDIPFLYALWFLSK